MDFCQKQVVVCVPRTDDVCLKSMSATFIGGMKVITCTWVNQEGETFEYPVVEADGTKTPVLFPEVRKCLLAKKYVEFERKEFELKYIVPDLELRSYEAIFQDGELQSEEYVYFLDFFLTLTCKVDYLSQETLWTIHARVSEDAPEGYSYLCDLHDLEEVCFACEGCEYSQECDAFYCAERVLNTEEELMAVINRYRRTD